MLCHGQTHMVLLPHHFFLLKAFRRNSRGHHNDLGIVFLEFERKVLQHLWQESFQPSLFSGQLELQPEVLADQGRRSNMSCQRTAPKHLFDLHKRATAQVLLLTHASPEVLPNPECPKGSLACLHFA